MIQIIHNICSLLNRMGKSDDYINIISLTGNFNRLIIKSNCNAYNQRYNFARFCRDIKFC